MGAAAIIGIGFIVVIVGVFGIVYLQENNILGKLPSLSDLQPDGEIQTISGSGAIDTEETARLIHELVNEQRQKAGVQPLEYDSKLAAVALAHSRDMATSGYFEHVNLQGKSNIDRFNDAGLNCFIRFPDGRYTNGSENLSLLQGGIGSEQSIAEDAVQSWLGSTAGHKENMLAKHWSSEGLGVAISPDGNKAYVTQTFC